MSKINIVRRTELINLFRTYKIIVNGKAMETIRNGKSIELNLKPGSYEIFCTIDWCGSNKIHLKIEETELQKLEIKSNPILKFTTYIGLTVGLIGLISILVNSFQDQVVPQIIFILMGWLLLQLYYLTLGRNKYLKIKPIA